MKEPDMFAVNEAPRYVAEAKAAAARLQESTTPEQYATLLERAGRLVSGLFTVEIRLDEEIQRLIALRERFDAPRVKQAILNVATWGLIEGLAAAWTGRRSAVPAAKREAAMV